MVYDPKETKNISDCSDYSALRKVLKKDSIIDNIVLHILEKDIKISRLNFDHIVLASGMVRRRYQSVPRGVNIGSFSVAEINTILDNWETLVTEMNLDNPKQAFGMFCKRPKKEDQLKANVLGLYLSQGLQKMRLAADVFNHSEDKILDFAKGKITDIEHDFIMEYMKNHGNSPHAFKDLSKLLNRRNSNPLRLYFLEQNTDLLKKGHYTISENKTIINEIITNSNIKTVLDIKNFYNKEGTVSKETFKNIAKLLGRHVGNIVCHWEKSLKPTLLQYHAGTLNFDVRPILVNFLVEKDLIRMQDIPW